MCCNENKNVGVDFSKIHTKYSKYGFKIGKLKLWGALDLSHS